MAHPHIALRLLLASSLVASGSGWTQSKESTAEITYKSTLLNVSEATFMREHRNQGFLCGPHSDGLLGRECTSTRATFAGFKAERTSAYFLHDKLIQVGIWYPKHEELAQNVLQHAAVVYELETKYGEANETHWPRQDASSIVTVWEKTWEREGKKLDYRCFASTLPSFNSNAYCFASVVISSIAGIAQFNAESERARSRRKRDL